METKQLCKPWASQEPPELGILGLVTSVELGRQLVESKRLTSHVLRASLADEIAPLPSDDAGGNGLRQSRLGKRQRGAEVRFENGAAVILKLTL